MSLSAMESVTMARRTYHIASLLRHSGDRDALNIHDEVLTASKLLLQDYRPAPSAVSADYPNDMSHLQLLAGATT